MVPQMPRLAVVLMAVALFFVITPVTHARNADVVARVDLSQQRMRVYVKGRQTHVWRVSTGKKGWRTPTGQFQPYLMYRNYYEKHWQAHLPFLVALTKSGIAIHGTNATHKLGRPASHGCIRLSISNASQFYRLVKKHGLRKTRVIVTQ